MARLYSLVWIDGKWKTFSTEAGPDDEDMKSEGWHTSMALAIDHALRNKLSFVLHKLSIAPAHREGLDSELDAVYKLIEMRRGHKE